MRTNLAALGLCLLAVGNVLVAPALQAQATPAGSAADAKYVPYRIARGDELSVGVFGEADLTGSGRKVDQKGSIKLPLIDDIRVVGLTLPEAQTTIENAYRDGRILRSPQVNVTVEKSMPRYVSISGKINIPARYEMPPDILWTLKDLIIKAGGLQETAQGRKVRITRTLPDGKSLTVEKDVEGMLKGRNANAADASFVLEPEDIVYVPEKVI